MRTVKLRYIGGLQHVDVPILSREGEPLDEHGEGCLVRGEVFTCDAKVAGRLPEYDEDGDIVDYGEGLLAQPSNFELVDDKAPPVKKAPKNARRARKGATKPKPAASPPMPAASHVADDETPEA